LSVLEQWGSVILFYDEEEKGKGVDDETKVIQPDWMKLLVASVVENGTLMARMEGSMGPYFRTLFPLSPL